MATSQTCQPEPEIIAYRVKDASRVSGIGITSLYAMMKDGRLEKRKVGGMTLIPAASLRSLIEGKAR